MDRDIGLVLNGGANYIPEQIKQNRATDITNHEGSKYLRWIKSAIPDEDGKYPAIQVDVYAVLMAFGVTCPAVAHAIKKCLAPGSRGKGTEVDDLVGVIAAISRAIQFAEQRRDESLGMEWTMISAVQKGHLDESTPPATTDNVSGSED